MFNAYEFKFDNSDYPQLVIAESLNKAISLLEDDAYHIIAINYPQTKDLWVSLRRFYEKA